MSQTVITSAFEQLKAQQAANGGVVVLDEFVFANVPDLNITDPIDRAEQLPDASMIVHRQDVGKTGMVNNNAVVYSVVMGADVGDFAFNWVGLVSKATGVVAMIVHAPEQKKFKTTAGQQGNVLTRSFLMEYNGASEQTQIITPADTWQIDFTARLSAVDERIRRENMDIYGAASFQGDGFLVSRNGSQYVVKKGAGYVAGIRSELLFDQNIVIHDKPVKVWLDVSWKGTLTSVWRDAVKITVAENLSDYQENDEQHFVSAIAEILADGSVIDLRTKGATDSAGIVHELNKKQPLDSTLTALAKLDTGKDQLPYFSGIDEAAQTALTETGREIIGSESVGDILRYLGQKRKVQDVATLRASEPEYAGQVMELIRFKAGCPLVNAAVIHDPSDLTSPDDGISVFVTAGGARWKADISNGYDLRLAGLLIDGSNFSPVLKTAINAIINKVVANGRVNNVTRHIRVVPTNFICEFKITEKVDIPSFIDIGCVGGPYFEAGDFEGDPFQVANQAYPQLTKAMFQAETSWKGATSKYWNQAIGKNPFISLDGQVINLRGPGYRLDESGNPTLKTTGIIFGNDVMCELDVRNLTICDMKITGFHTSHRWGTYYTFMCGFRNCYFSRCWNGMEVPEAFYNFGEDMYYENCTFGNMAHYGFWIKGGGAFSLTNVRLDFIGSDGIHFGPLSPGIVTYISGNIEGVQGQLVAKDTPQSYSKSTVHLGKAVRRDTRRTIAGLSDEYYGITQEYGCPPSVYGQMLVVTDESYCQSRQGKKPNTAYPTLAGHPGNTGVNITNPRSIDGMTPWPNSYSPACSNRVNKVIEFTDLSTGDVGGDLLSTDYAFAALKTGNATCRYGTKADATDDGYMPFIITLTDPNEVVQLFCTNQVKAESGMQLLWGSGSIRIADATGNVMVSMLMASYLRNSVRAVLDTTTNLITASSTPIRRAIAESAAINMTEQRKGTQITPSDYQAIIPQSVDGYWQGSDFIQAGVKFTGCVGTFYYKLPIWWFVKG
ncbi:TPA: phage tail protein [Klebsiella variicola]